MLTTRYDYNSFKRTKINGKRVYNTESGPLPSVTTILSDTKPLEDRKALQEWQRRVGDKEAQRVSNEAANVGTLMHGYLEDWVNDGTYDRKDGIIHRVAGSMADTIIKEISPHIGELWGTEVNLYYPSLYAGTTDLVGVWKDKPAIMDFKQTNRPKKKEYITDYFLQACAYGAAHNVLYGTNINSVAIFMCSRDCEFQLFELDECEFEHFTQKWAERLTEFYGLNK